MRERAKSVAEQLKALEAMSAAELRAQWQASFGRSHPGWVQREFLLYGLAYQVQEKALGGLSGALERTLSRHIGHAGEKPRDKHKIRIKAGTRLVREWGGETHVVTVHAEDFEYRGKRFQSLSEVARTIAKTRWSGPAFFGLKGATTPRHAARA